MKNIIIIILILIAFIQIVRITLHANKEFNKYEIIIQKTDTLSKPKDTIKLYTYHDLAPLFLMR